MFANPFRCRGAVLASLLTVVVGVPVLLIGCRGEPAAPVRREGPAFDWMNNPDNGNIRIRRYQTGFAISWTDPTTGLRATHTTFPLSATCGPLSVLDPVDVQDVGLLTDPKVHQNLNGPVWIIIRDVTQSGTCFGNKLIGQGTGQIHYTDNDFFGPGPEGGNSDAFGFMAQGDVTPTGGGAQLHYNGALRFTARFLGGDPSDPNNYDVQIRTRFVNVR